MVSFSISNPEHRPASFARKSDLKLSAAKSQERKIACSRLSSRVRVSTASAVAVNGLIAVSANRAWNWPSSNVFFGGVMSIRDQPICSCPLGIYNTFLSVSRRRLEREVWNLTRHPDRVCPFFILLKRVGEGRENQQRCFGRALRCWVSLGFRRYRAKTEAGVQSRWVAFPWGFAQPNLRVGVTFPRVVDVNLRQTDFLKILGQFEVT